MNKGKFITIEGSEGVGKSTQLRFLKEYAEKNNLRAVFTREPGGTPIAEKIRSVILDVDNAEMDGLTELLLYAAARRQHTEEFIKKNIEAGVTVFCDRYIDSTTAYQGYARGLPLDIIDTLNRWTADINIDLTIFLNVPPSEGFRRKGGADEDDRIEQEESSFFHDVYNGFTQLASRHPDRIAAVDASGTKFETHEKILKLLKDRGII